jgi:hypothetical protein
VTAPLGTISQGATVVDIALTAATNASRGEQPGVRAVGTTAALVNMEFPSLPFVVSVRGPASFQLTVDPATVVVRQSGSANVKVSALRRDYDGPIDVVLQGLPKGVSAGPATIAERQNGVVIALAAQGNAPTGDTNTVSAVGAAAPVNITNVLSPNFTISVKPPGTFELKVDPATVSVKQGANATLKVTAVRKGYDGPIAVETHKLPSHVTASKATIAAGASTAEIVLTADVKAAVGDHGGAHAHGSAEGHKVDSPTFMVKVQKK